jgi:hypothetical protein
MSTDDRTLTVAQLIEKLKEMPQDIPVYTEGCDCTGNAAGVMKEGSGEDECVVITRTAQ